MKKLKRISRIFFPDKCSICRQLIPFHQDFCHCQGEEMIAIGNDICFGCGKEKSDCCCKAPNNIILSHLASVYSYEAMAKTKLHSFKFNGKKALGSEFSLSMSERVAVVFPEIDFDLVTFVPADKISLRERGYNQSEILARGVAGHLFLPVENLLTKTQHTKNQHHLSSKERTENLVGKIRFTSDYDIKGKTVLLCDDVKTTGATLNECSKVLLNAGAKDVYCITFAVTPYFSSF